MLTVVCISDTHGKHRSLDLSTHPGDVLVFAGDWTRGRDLGFSETEDFLQWLSEQPYKHKICIAGNHDVQVEAQQNYFKIIILPSYPDVIYLQDSSITIDGINFYGSPYSNEFFNWAFMEDELALAKRWQQIPDNTDVLITHGPAYGSHDLVKCSYEKDPHVGSQSLTHRKRALQHTLKSHISGHIHEAYGTSKGSCLNVCPCVLNEQYKLVNDPITITI